MLKNWKEQNLNYLESTTHNALQADCSYVVRRCSILRQTPLQEFTTEDLRIMIGQQQGLMYLIPLALEILINDPFVEGDFFPGDLLQNTLNIPLSFWQRHPHYWEQLNRALVPHRCNFKELGINSAHFDKAL